MARENDTSETDGAPLWNIAAGLDRSVVPTRINDLGLAHAYDVVIVDGIIKPRPGANATVKFPTITSWPYQVPAFFHVLRERVTQDDVAISCSWDFTASSGDDASLFILQENGNVWATALLLDNSSNYDTPPQITSFKDVSILLPGNGRALWWATATGGFSILEDLQADTDLKPPTNCRVIESSGSRVFMANGCAYGTTERLANRVWWSDSGREKVWSNGTGKPERGTASFEDLQQGEFGTYEITALKMHSSMQLLAFKAWGIWAATWAGDVVTWTFIPGTFKIGTIANRTIQQWQDKLIFFGTDYNIYAIGTDRSVRPVGTKVQRYIASIINNVNANRCCAAVNPVENLYYLWIPIGDDAFPRHLIILNLETGAITEGRMPLQVTCAYAYFPGFDASPGIFLMQNVEGGVLRELTYATGCNDVATPFQPYIWSKVYDYNEMYQGVAETGEIHKIALHGIQGKATARARTAQGLYELANASSPDLLTFGEIDVTANLAHYVSERTQAARFAQWGVQWTSGDASPLHLQGVTVYGLPRMGSERGGG